MYFELMYSLGFSVLSKEDEATPQQIIEELERRVAYLKANPDEIMEAVGLPDDCCDIDEPYKVDVDDFKKKWSQSHSEICSELGYDEEEGWNLIPDTYFYHEKDGVWYNRECSLFTAREELIAEWVYQNQ
jgi:hypothetical protein